MRELRHTRGRQGEAYAAAYLITQGFTILARNFTAPPGEIDIVAQKDDLLIFVEVKTRRRAYFMIGELVPPVKRRKIIDTARFYLLHYEPTHVIIRFDVILLESCTCTHIEHAFTTDS